MSDNFAKLKKEVDDIVQAYIKAKTEGKLVGWLATFMFIFSILGELIEVVEEATAIATGGKDKKALVVESFEYAYKTVNPNIPMVPGFVQGYIEEWLFKNAVPAFIDWLVTKWNHNSQFKTNEPMSAEFNEHVATNMLGIKPE